MDTEKQMQCRCDDMRLTKSQKQGATGSYPELLTNREWLCQESSCRVPSVKGPAGFRYDISDLFILVDNGVRMWVESWRGFKFSVT